MAEMLREVDGRELSSPAQFLREIVEPCLPVVMRGLVSGWPAVHAATRSVEDFQGYLARFDDGTNHEFTGLYTVNRDQLKELADAAALDLFRRGYLQLIYLMLASRGHVSALARRKNRSFLPGGDSRGGQPPDDASRGSGLA